MANPLAPHPVEIVLAVSFLLSLALAAFVIVGAARGRFGWGPATVLAVIALAVPVVGLAVTLYCVPKLARPVEVVRAS